MAEARTTSDLAALERMALLQGGYFDRADALAHNLQDSVIHYHTRTGRFERVSPGVYRLAVAPISPYDDLLHAVVWSNYRGAISHESALALFELGDVEPHRVQLTVPLNFGRTSSPCQLHRAALRADEVTIYQGIPVTTPVRTIVDAASAGTDPEQIRKATGQALSRALATDQQILATARRPHYRNRRAVLSLVELAIRDASA